MLVDIITKLLSFSEIKESTLLLFLLIFSRTCPHLLTKLEFSIVSISYIVTKKCRIYVLDSSGEIYK